MINNRYKQEEEFGKGSFATVFKGTDIKLGNSVAIKFIEATYSALYLIESKVFISVSGREHFPKMFWSGEHEKNFYIVMELIEKSLANVILNESFDLKKILQMGIQILSALETLHSLGYIHRDIKPDNILMNKSHDSYFLIDYGLCKNFIDSATKHHAPMREDNAFKGNLIFCSKNILSGISASRRDDIESLCLLLIYLVKKELPWINEKKNLECMIGRRSSVNFTHFMQGLPSEIFEIFGYTQTLTYYQTPNYKWILEKLNLLKSRLSDPPPRMRKPSHKKSVKRARTAASNRRIIHILECETLIIPPPEFTLEFRYKIQLMRKQPNEKLINVI